MLDDKVRLLGVILFLTSCLSCGGGFSVAYREGHKAEDRKDWDTALVDYEKARKADPANSLYILHEKEARINASLFHLKNGRQLLKEGRYEEAAGELSKAASIDPTNQAASQELQNVLAKQAKAKREHQANLKEALKARDEAGETTGVKLQPFSQEPIPRIRVSTDSRHMFETLAKLAGINVAFTPDFRPAPLSEDLANIKIEDALKIVAMQTKSFWKAVTTNTILVIPDNPNNRRDYDDEILKTIYLTNPLAPADRTAITTALKQVLGLQRIMDNPDSNAIIVRDSPTKVAAAEQLIRQLDRGKAEILIDIDIVEADRDRIRDLGLSLATVSTSGSVTQGLQGGVAFVGPPSSSTTGSTVANTAISALSWRDYAISIPGATAQAVLNDSKTHIMQSPQVRVTDGQTAKLRIGSRIPYATGSFLPSFGGSTGSSSGGNLGLLASTQFQFQDIGVNLDLTPHLLASGEVAVHAKIEISSLGASISVGGLSQPTFGQRIIEDDFRLVEGEVNLLGGLIQSTINNLVTGVPGLGDIPFLHYFFSNEHKEVNDQEVIVMLTPRVIRLPEAGVTAGGGLPVGAAGGGDSRPGFQEAPQPFQVPNPGGQP